MTRDGVDGTLGPRADTQDGHAAGLDLRPARIVYDLGGEPRVARPAAQLEHLVLRLGLDGDLGLAVLFPAREDGAQGRVGGGAGQGLVAGEGGVGALRGDFACCGAAS